MAGVLRSTTTRGTAQHNRGIKRKRSITQIAPPCRVFLPRFQQRIAQGASHTISHAPTPRSQDTLVAGNSN
jgi:hypothetical protein